MKKNNYAFEVAEKKVLVEGTEQVIPGKKCILRTDTQTPLSIVSDRYNVIPHADIVTEFETALNELGPTFKARTITTSLPHGGAKMYRKYTFDTIGEEVVPGDITKLTLELVNSYDGTMKAGYNLGGFRLACTNGLIVGVKMMELHSKHFASFNLAETVKGLKNVIPAFQATIGKWREWHATPMAVEDAEKFLSGVILPAKTKEMIQVRFNTAEEKTKWGLFQAATWVTSHKIVAKKEENNRFSKIQNEGALIPAFYGRKLEVLA